MRNNLFTVTSTQYTLCILHCDSFMFALFMLAFVFVDEVEEMADDGSVPFSLLDNLSKVVILELMRGGACDDCLIKFVCG